MRPAGGPGPLPLARPAPAPPWPRHHHGGVPAELEPLLAAAHKAMKKSGVSWVEVDGERARPVWMGWAADALHVVVGGGEQEVPGLAEATSAVVSTPAESTGSLLVRWRASVSVLTPRSPEWDAAAAVLAEKRLNLGVADDTLARWAAGAALVRLAPTGEVLEAPGCYAAESGAAAPAATPATTPARRPWTLGRATRRRPRPLS